MLKIATMADWFGKGLLQGIRESARCGAVGVQLYAWNELNPFDVTNDIIREVRTAAADNGQTITALCGELSEITRGGRGLEEAAHNARKIEFLKRTIDMAKALGCDVVTTHIGVVPENQADPRYGALLAACGELGEYAAANGAWLAIETGPEPVERLCAFTDACPGGRVAVNYDPANLVMVTNVDEVAGVYAAGKRIVHTHAKDGVIKRFLGADEVYGIFAEGGIEALAKIPEYFEEKPLGEGSVHWPQYIQALRDVGYDGYLTIEREVGQNPAVDIQMAVRFLKELLGQA